MPKRIIHDPHGVKVTPPRGESLPLFSVVNCPRCAKPCLIRDTVQTYDSPFVRLEPAKTAQGLCEECAAHWWLFSIDGFRWSFQDGPGVLCMPIVQTELSRMMGLMHPALGTVDWGRMIAQWELPWPEDWTLPKDSTSDSTK